MRFGGEEARVGIIGCRHTTLDVIHGLARRGAVVDHCVTIPPEEAARAKVPGYVDLTATTPLDVAVTVVRDYGLRHPPDRSCVLELRLQALLVVGWGRLLPDWLLEALPLGAFGVHGSSRPLPFGRGRSPVNWTLAEGANAFYTHLFRLTTSADEGPIVGVRRLPVSPFDDALTLHFKNTVARTALCLQVLPSILAGTPPERSQPREGATWLPRRTAADRMLRWSRPTEELRNLVRAEARPFNGCHTSIGGRALGVWAAIPFEMPGLWDDRRPGEVLEVFSDGEFVVRTGDGALLVREYDGGPLTPSDVGAVLDGAGAVETT